MYGRPGSHNISRLLSSAIIGIDAVGNVAENVADLPDFELQEKLNNILETSNSKDLMVNTEERYDAGIPIIGDIPNEIFCNIITNHRIIKHAEKALYVRAGFFFFSKFPVIPESMNYCLNFQN